MTRKKKITVSWSGGKDSAFALFKILTDPLADFEVVSLHTTIGEDTKRVGLHGVREELIMEQAKALNLPLVKLYLKSSTAHQIYEDVMAAFYEDCAAQGISSVLFGDIFLEDLKAYRENLLKPSGLQPVYPLWKIDTKLLVEDFIRTGFKTVICSAHGDHFSREQLGVTITPSFIDSLPPVVDPCGEKGEFHTFVYDGPLFDRPIAFSYGDIVSKSYTYQKKLEDGSLQTQHTAFWFQDLLPLMAS